jgi:hypothetical protein
VEEELRKQGFSELDGIWINKDFPGLEIWKSDIWYDQVNGMICDCFDPETFETPANAIQRSIEWYNLNNCENHE